MRGYQTIAGIAFGLALMMGLPDIVSAQVNRYTPHRATVSPYLSLSQTNTGGLPNYYSLVRPQLQQNAYNAAQGNILNQQGQRLQQLSNELQTARPPVAPTGQAAGYMYPGHVSGFMNTRLYYPPVNFGQGRAR